MPSTSSPQHRSPPQLQPQTQTHRITRYREPRTCTSCRARKLKCDRGRPCASCVKRNDGGACEYRGHSGSGLRDAAGENGGGMAGRRGEARLRHLETLVRGLVQEGRGGSGSGSGSGGGSGSGSELGIGLEGREVERQVRGSGSEVYAGSTSYLAMIEDIEELRRIYEEDGEGEGVEDEDDDGVIGDDLQPRQQQPRQQSYEERTRIESGILLGSGQMQTLAEILSTYLPPKKTMDRCLASYFRAEMMAAPFIHVPQFRQQYEDFWQSPQQTSPLWISILFSICQISRSVGPTSPADDLPDFSMAAALCLASGRYSRPQRHGIEALLLYIQIKVVEGWDPSHDLGVLFSIAIQLAYARGYHRDPDHFQHITPFDGEIRRRAWSLCLQLNLLNSFQLGLPCNIQPGSWDIRLPSNYLDTDINPSMEVLPPPRPETDLTRQLSFNAKHMLMAIFHKIQIYTHSHTSNDDDEATIQSLDAELQAAYASIPEDLRHRSVAASLSDKGFLIASRRCVDMLYLKCLCVLHRRPMTRRNRAESRRICTQSATTIVSNFLDMYPEFQPGGQFFCERWLLSSITWNDFLLGIMVLVSVLCLRRIARTEPQYANGDSSGFDEATLVNLLQASLETCRERTSESVGARRAVKVLESLLHGSTPSFQNVSRNSNGIHKPSLSTLATISTPATFSSGNHVSGLSPTVPTSITDSVISDQFLADWDVPMQDLFGAEDWDVLEAQLWIDRSEGTYGIA